MEDQKYNFREIERKWQKKWDESGLYKTEINSEKPKFYCLDMFPFPSGAGLHVGHPKGYIATDVIARFKILNGYNVLHPMGWDAFGLPAENYAIKNKIHPSVAVKKNIERYKEQLKKIGFTYDWNKEINTSDSNYYKWTQWIFLKMFEKGLAYQSDEPINWCPSCKTGLANEDLEDGKCERCGTPIEQKKMKQWVLKITDYADRLLYDLDNADLDWEESIKEQQRNWIGKSSGAAIKFEIRIPNSEKKYIEVFTTRPDTIFGCTFLVLSPEHQLITNYEIRQPAERITNYGEVKKYIEEAKKKSEMERMDASKDKTGVKLDGIMAINPATGEEIPIFVADYVLCGYGTGAIMAVPAHDERDFEFAKKFNLPIRKVVLPEALQTFQRDIRSISMGVKTSIRIESDCFAWNGININSEFLNGLKTEDAKEKIIEWLEANKIGKRKVNYKMRDWVFSRQRYWGEPIPIVKCESCGLVSVPEDQLPLELPDVESYEPTGTGESPLANIADWVNTTCPKCGGPAKRETNTMPNWAGSSWYYLRYIDPKNSEVLVNSEKEKYWMPVDLYVGGAEHATRHLLYARFWHKFLYDIGVVSTSEPFKKLVHVGLINAEDGRKMSKRWGNVINPDDIIDEFGADALRTYEMFMGPFIQNIAWNTDGVKGIKRFLDRIFLLRSKIKNQKSKNWKTENLLHKAIKKVTEDIEQFKFNTAISAMMILINEMERQEEISQNDFEKFLILLSPFAPHLAEELWSELGNTESIFKQKWPEYDPEFIKEEEMEIPVQINGKVRDTIKVPADFGEEEIKKMALESEKVKKWIGDKEIRKVIYVKGKMVSIVL